MSNKYYKTFYLLMFVLLIIGSLKPEVVAIEFILKYGIPILGLLVITEMEIFMNELHHEIKAVDSLRDNEFKMLSDKITHLDKEYVLKIVNLENRIEDLENMVAAKLAEETRTKMEDDMK